MQLEFSSFFVPRNVAWIYFLCHAVSATRLGGKLYFGEESMDLEVCTAAASPLVDEATGGASLPDGKRKKAILHHRCVRRC